MTLLGSVPCKDSSVEGLVLDIYSEQPGALEDDWNTKVLPSLVDKYH